MLASSQNVAMHELEEFDSTTQLCNYGYYLMIGPLNSGKTTAARSIAKKMRGHTNAQHIAIPGDKKNMEEWNGAVHTIFKQNCSAEKDMFPDLAIAALDQIITEQKRRVCECEILKIPFPKKWEVKLFIDGCGYMKNFMFSKQMKWVACNVRHIKTNVFLIVRNLQHVSKESQDNIDAVICFKPLHVHTIRSLHSEFLFMYSLQTFRNILASIKQNHALIFNRHPVKKELKHTFFFSNMNPIIFPQNFLIDALCKIVGEYASEWMQPT